MPQAERPCPLRARSGGKTWALTVNHGTNAATMTCISAGQTGSSRSLPSWCCDLYLRVVTVVSRNRPIVNGASYKEACGFGSASRSAGSCSPPVSHSCQSLDGPQARCRCGSWWCGSSFSSPSFPSWCSSGRADESADGGPPKSCRPTPRASTGLVSPRRSTARRYARCCSRAPRRWTVSSRPTTASPARPADRPGDTPL